MTRIHVLIISALLLCLPAVAQQKVIDAEDGIPVAAASIFDAEGNVIGYTLADGTFSEISDAAYPITLRCLGYEPLEIELPKDTAWSMKPNYFGMQELVVVPVERSVMKQTFYIREYFSLSSTTNTATFFTERMAYRFVPATKDAETGVSSKMHEVNTRSYSQYKDAETDSVEINDESHFSITFSLMDLSDKEVVAPKSFNTPSDSTKLFEQKGKSGFELVAKQSEQVFTITKDGLADKKNHTYSPWPLKLLGMTMDINQLYITKAFRVNDEGSYISKDLLQSSFVMEADCRGKVFRKLLESDKPVLMRIMAEMYIVDREFFTKEEAIVGSKKETQKAEFVIPSGVPPLNDATQELVNRAEAERSQNK